MQGGVHTYAARGIDRSPTQPGAKYRRQKCPRQDSNLYAVSDTGPSNQPVYQFQHVGDTETVQTAQTDQQCSRRDSNPHGVNPHRVLNPARLPIPPPERSTGLPTRSNMEPRGIEPLTS